MHDFERTGIKSSIQKLSSCQGDVLRVAQSLFADLISSGDQQQEAVWVAVQAFLALNPPQRMAVLHAVQTQINQERTPCLAFDSNGRFFDWLMESLSAEMGREVEVSDEAVWRWFQRMRSKIRKERAHGSPEHIQEVLSVIAEIRNAAQKIALPESSFQINPELVQFTQTLSDEEFGRLIRLVVQMRDVKACRNRGRAVVDSSYVQEELGLREPKAPEECNGILEIMSERAYLILRDFYVFLRIKKHLVAQMAAMDFQQLTLLENQLSGMRAAQFTQGVMR